MKSTNLFLAAAAALAGAGITWLVKPTPPRQVTAPPAVVAVDNSALESAQRRIAELEERLANLEKAPAIPIPTPAERAADPITAAAADIQGLVQESRPLLARMTPMFTQWMNRGIERQVESLSEQLNLTPAQTEALRAKLSALGAEEMKKFNERLSDPTITPDKLFQPSASPFDPTTLSTTLKETLTPEQFANYEKQQTEDRVQRLERQANSQAERLGRRLNLTEQQKDQVFSIMVKSSDPSLQVETGTGANAEVTPGGDRDTAIRAILTPEQLKIYEADAQRDNERRNRWRQMMGGGR